MKLNQAYIIGETIVWSVFIIIMGLIGLMNMSIIRMSPHSHVVLGRIALAFSLLAFFYIVYLGSQRRGK